MEPVQIRVLSALDQMGIRYDLISHPPASTIDECLAVQKRLRGVVPKNLFLTTRRGQDYYLCLVRPSAQFKSGEVSRQAGTSRLCFAPEQPLWELLCARPGSVSPMGLLFDTQRRVRLLVDGALRDEPRLIFHPCLNTFSLAMCGEDFFGVFLPATGHDVTWIEVTP